jgi:hypothetical protein
MLVKEEVLKSSPIWVLRFIYADMLAFAYNLAEVPDCDMETISDHVEYLGKFDDAHIQQIVQHLNLTSVCIWDHSLVNMIDIKVLKQGDEIYDQAKTTWDTTTKANGSGFKGYKQLLTDYSDTNYSHCISLWNCAYQILLNERDVYNDTFSEFLESLEELTNGGNTYGDQRTQPLFKLISQIGNFHIIYTPRKEK